MLNTVNDIRRCIYGRHNKELTKKRLLKYAFLLPFSLPFSSVSFYKLFFWGH